MANSSTRSASLRSFRRLLRPSFRLGANLGDSYMSQFFRSRCKFLHRPALLQASSEKQLIAQEEAKQLLRTLQQALKGKLKAINKVHELAYGQSGAQRTRFLRPYLAQIQPSDKPKHPLLQSNLSHRYAKRVNNGPPWPMRDVVVQGPLSECRVKNIRNRWWSNVVLDGLQPPLPQSLLQHLEQRAQRCGREEQPRTALRGEGKVSKQRFIRRRAQALLDIVPVWPGAGDGVHKSEYSLEHASVPPLSTGLAEWYQAGRDSSPGPDPQRKR